MKAQAHVAAVAGALALATGQASGGGVVVGSPNQAVHSPASVTHSPARVTLNNGPVTLKSRTVKPHCAAPVVVVPGYSYCYPGPLYTGYYRPFGYYDADDSEYRRESSPSPPVTSAEWNFYQSGREWGQDLRREVTTWEKFVYYVKSYVVKAVATLRAQFRRGFIESYGLNAEAAFAKALQEAVAVAPPTPSTGPKVIVVTPK